MTEQIQSRLNIHDLDEDAVVEDDTDDSHSWSAGSMSSTHKLSSISSVTTMDPDAVQDLPVPSEDNVLRRMPTLAASVKINVEGAFIVEDEVEKEEPIVTEHVHWERKDIRLPHHTDVVSHVAVDVGSI